MSTSRVIFAILLSSYLLVQFSGCSLVGLGVGALSDGMSPDEYIFSSPAGLDSITTGSLVEVRMADGTVVSGEYEGIDIGATADYSKRYTEALASLPSGHLMPSLGDSILVITRGVLGRKTYPGHLLGFGDAVVLLQPSQTAEPIGVFVKAVDTLLHSGTVVVPGEVLRVHMNNGDIPFMTRSVRDGVVLIRDSLGTERIPVKDVLSVRQPDVKNRWLKLLLAGAVVDVVLVIIVANMELEFKMQ